MKIRNLTTSLYTTLLAALLVVSCQMPGRGRTAGNADSATETYEYEREDSIDSAADDNQTGLESDEDSARVGDNAVSSEASNPVCGLPKVSSGTAEVILRRAGYTCSFNTDNRIPNWVAWELTADHTDGPYKRGGIKFQEDEGVTTYDYARSGYDRGHMCPSGDNKWSEEAQEQSFLMTNMCPQNHNLNAGDWNEMEMQCRRWAEQFGKVDIMAGPILFRGKHKKIGNGVVVPEAFFKVVYCPSKEMAIGFIYRNEPGNRPKGDYVNSVAQIERITGFKFLTALPSAKAEKIKKEADLSDWY